MERDPAHRRELLKELMLPGALYLVWITEEHEQLSPDYREESGVRTKRSKRALTVEDLEKALEFRQQPVRAHYPSGYRDLARPDGSMRPPDRYDLAPGKGKDGRRGILRVLYQESHIGGSC